MRQRASPHRAFEPLYLVVPEYHVVPMCRSHKLRRIRRFHMRREKYCLISMGFEQEMDAFRRGLDNQRVIGRVGQRSVTASVTVGGTYLFVVLVNLLCQPAGVRRTRRQVVGNLSSFTELLVWRLATTMTTRPRYAEEAELVSVALTSSGLEIVLQQLSERSAGLRFCMRQKISAEQHAVRQPLLC